MLPKSLESLERQRASIADQIAVLGDLRPGSVTPTHWPVLNICHFILLV